MTKLFFLGMIFLLSAPFLRAQKPLVLANNIVYGEALGIGGYYSLNYERVLLRAFRQRMMITAAIGISGYSSPKDEQEFYFLERINIAYGYKSVFLDVGANLTLQRYRSYSFKGDYWLLWTESGTVLPNVGLRFQKKGWPYMRISVLPIRNSDNNRHFISLIEKSWRKGPERYWWWGLSVGYAF